MNIFEIDSVLGCSFRPATEEETVLMTKIAEKLTFKTYEARSVEAGQSRYPLDNFGASNVFIGDQIVNGGYLLGHVKN